MYWLQSVQVELWHYEGQHNNRRTGNEQQQQQQLQQQSLLACLTPKWMWTLWHVHLPLSKLPQIAVLVAHLILALVLPC